MLFAVRHKERRDNLHAFLLEHKGKHISWQVNTYPMLLSHHRLELCPIFIILEWSRASVFSSVC